MKTFKINFVGSGDTGDTEERTARAVIAAARLWGKVFLKKIINLMGTFVRHNVVFYKGIWNNL